MGNNCGFGARIFKSHDQRSKYYNSRENEHFIKGSILFGLDLAKQEIQNSGTCFLVEGYTDCIAMVQHGYKNTVATLGTACTQEHLKQLSRYAKVLYVLYDGDSAGQKAILRLTALCWQESLDLKVVTLPQQDDPASFLEKGNKLELYIKNAKGIFEFFIETLGDQFSKTEFLQNKLNIVYKFIEIIKQLKDPIKQDILLQTASHKFDIPFESLKKECLKTKNTNNFQAKSDIKEQKEDHSLLEKKITFAIINDCTLLKMEDAPYLVEYFSSPLSVILKKIKSFHDKNVDYSFEKLLELLDEDEKQCVSKLVFEYDKTIDPKTFKILLQQFHKKYWKKIINDIKIKLVKAVEEQNQDLIQKLFLDLKNFKKYLSKKGLV